MVHARLIRVVGRGELPSGPVFVKLMTFPRAKDRLRYALRPLPAVHEARLLAAVAAASIPCPEVVAAHAARRHLLPACSMLVLRALPVVPAPDGRSPPELLRERACLAARLLAAGIVHTDLNAANFVWLADGRLAVLDLQSARLRRPESARAHAVRIAARLLRDCDNPGSPAAAAALLDSGLLRDGAGVAAARWHADADARAFLRGRILRCLGESTEFTRVLRASGVEHRRRGELPPGRWIRGGRGLRRCWLGQRALELFENRSPRLPAYLSSWWWLPGRSAVYVPADIDEPSLGAELQMLAAGHARWLRSRWLPGRPVEVHAGLANLARGSGDGGSDDGGAVTGRVVNDADDAKP
jgi:tRNA A-37 threonylcarbamoyl transferase component Bud32